MLDVALVIFGLLIATITMAIGIGGGILWTPLLILVYGLAPVEAVTTSLFIQVAGLSSGTFAYARANLVKFKLSLTFFVVALPGVFIGSFFTLNLSPNIVQLALGIMALILAMLFVVNSQEVEHDTSSHFDAKKIKKILPIPAVFGFIMGFLSLGISEWLIPALRNKLRMAMPKAIGTSIATMLLLALVASSIHFYFSESLHLKIIALGAAGTLIGGQIGAYISQRINDRLLQQSFIYLMTLIGIHLIFQAL